MCSRMRLDDFAALLPATAHLPLDDARQGFTWVDADLPGYVWPETTDDLDPQARVVLVSAAGAMGKSVAARAIARRSGALLLDASTSRVGAHTITGGLTKSLGPDGFAEFTRRLHEGNASFVIDGVDEALLASGSQNFEAFLQDFIWLLSDPVAITQVVILGREDAMDSVQLILEFGGITCARTQLDALDYADACQFIDEYLDRRVAEGTAYLVHREHRSPFGQLRDRVLEDLGRALHQEFSGLSDWHLGRDFLGYPAVLLAVAERLAVNNPGTELGIYRGTGVSNQLDDARGSLLLGIVRNIVDREQLKVARLVGNALALPESDPLRKVLYTEDEQVARLLNIAGGSADLVYGPEALRDDDRAAYDEQIRSFLADHPFLRGRGFANVVFADYVRAYSASSPLSGIQQPQIVCSATEVGPFFGHFVAAIGSKTTDEFGTISQLPLEYVDHIVQSIRLSRTNFEWSFHSTEGSGGRLEIVGDSSSSQRVLRYEIHDCDDVLAITAPLSHCYITTHLPVVIRSQSGEVRLGPNVLIASSEVAIDGEEVRIAPRRKRGDEASSEPSGFGVFISADTEIENHARVAVTTLERDCLLVATPNPVHPWREYHFRPPNIHRLVKADTWRRILVVTRRCLNLLHPLSNDRIGASGEGLQKYIAGTDVGEAVFASLFELGILEKSGSYVLLVPDALSRHGVHHVSLTGADLQDQLQSLLDAVLNTDAMEAYLAQ